MISFIFNKKQQVEALCAQYNVKQLYAFGSVCTDKFNDSSDIDLLYRFSEGIPEEKYPDNFFAFEDALTKLFNREVDLVPEQYLRNPYFIKELEKTKILIYDR